MAHIALEHYDYIEDKVKQYCSGTYFIGFEDTPYHHYHFCVEMTEEQYANFRSTVFIKKFKLKGQARDGKAREYGLIHNIKDIEKMKAYTIKEGNYRTNLSDVQELEQILENSFSKKEKVDKEKEILKQLHIQSIEEMRVNAIRLCVEIGNNPRPSRSRVDQLVVMKLVEAKRWVKVYEILYNRELSYYKEI